jgi:hypothetical protein
VRFRKFLCALSLHGVLLVAGSAFAQSYNARTGEIEMPGSPAAPSAPLECDQLASKWQQLQQQLEVAHQSCLDAHQHEPQNPRASSDPADPICSHAECQSLHGNRLQMIANGNQAVSACRTRVAIRQRQESSATGSTGAPLGSPMPDAQLPSAVQPQDVAAARTEAARKIARAMEENAAELKLLVAERQAKYATAAADSSSASEFAPVPDNSIPPLGDSLDTGTNLVHQGNPPDTAFNSWVAGARLPTEATGFYDKEIYSWQYLKDDPAQCPATSLSGVTVTLQALFQEVAVVHYHLTNGLIDHSVVDKQLQFLRCIPAGNPNYPVYRLTNTPSLGIKSGSASGTRG